MTGRVVRCAMNDAVDGGGEDVEDLLKKLAAAEAEAKAAKEETASWKVKHGELRAFVAAELVNDAASK